MSNMVNALISSNTAARLLFTNDIDISSCSWSVAQSETVLHAVLKMDIVDMLDIIDRCKNIDLCPAKVPQFSSVEQLIRIPFIFKNNRIRTMTFCQLGLYLRNDPSAKVGALLKYGETHGKGASFIGLSCVMEGDIVPSSLTDGFCEFSDDKEQKQIATKLCFRIPVIQEILKQTAKGAYNGYNALSQLSDSTRIRRAICIRSIIKALQELNNETLNSRLDNLYWEL